MLAGALAGANSTLVVHGLDSDAGRIGVARKHFQGLDAVTRLSAEHWTGPLLPYADNLVNLLIVEAGRTISKNEATRVLAPGGVAVYRDGSGHRLQRKERGSPDRDWTHYQFEAAGNPVGKDHDQGLPRRFQWSGTPLWSAAHESMASLNAMVSSGGRVFYIMDEGPRASVQLPADWNLTARDAHNGVVLWRKPIQRWLTRYWPWKSGPAQMPRKLIAVGDRVYAPLDINGPLKQFDAATGEELRTYTDTGAAEEVIHTSGILLVQVNPNPPDMDALEKEVRERRHFSYDGRNRAIIDHEGGKQIVALEASTGKELWRHDAQKVSPLSMSALKEKVVYHDGERLVCLDLRSGARKWMSEVIDDRKPKLILYSEESATVVLHEKVAYYARDKKMTAVSMDDGRTLWKSQWTSDDYRSPVTVMLMKDLVWSMNITSAKAPGTFIGRDLLTGDIKKQFDLPPFKGIGHHRCYKAKASGDFVLLSRSGVEYVDPSKESYDENHWIRGACLYGILPANGMLYSTPHACACYIKGKLNGFTAMTPGPTASVLADYSMNPVEKGGAYPAKAGGAGAVDDWPTYRGDFSRSGRVATTVPAELKETWSARVGGDLTTVTVGHGLVFVAQKERNAVRALRVSDGSEAWSFVAGGKVDSPPSVDSGRVYFGSADGHVYCLNAEDGALAWRTRAAPGDRRVMAYGRVESAWPVNGSVLVQKEAVYAAAGRSSFLDGGIHVVKIDAETGKVLFNYNVYDLETGEQPPLTSSFDMEGALPDILSGDGERVFMRHLGFDAETLSPREKAPHVFSPAGYLDDTWWHRIYWVYGDDTKGGYGGWWQAGNKLPAGRIMVYDDESVYAFGRSFYAGMNSAQFGRGEKYILSAADKKGGAEPDFTKVNQQRKLVGDLKIDWQSLRTTPFKWTNEIPFHPRAMVLAGETLFAAGPFGDAVRSADSFEGRRGVRLAAVSTKTGALLSSFEIGGMPVWDGMAAAGGSLFVAMRDGTVRRFGGSGSRLKSTLGEAVEILPETLLADDTEYRAMVQSKVGAPKGDSGPAARGVLKGKSLAGQFGSVTGGKVVKSPLGFRLGANDREVARVLDELKEPVLGRAKWRLKIRAAEGFPNPPYYQNGFFALGDGGDDEKLIKCGLQFIQKTARIIQGPTSKQRGATVKLAGDPDKVFELEVAVDFAERKVTMSGGGSVLSVPMPAGLNQISHVGLIAWNSVTDFSAWERLE